jgi:hypothetical protein
MTPAQSKRFNKLCKDMAALLDELEVDHPDVTLFAEDGCLALYDWPEDVERRPDEAFSSSNFIGRISGGGR